jgi:hypothetical protein
VTPFPIIFGSDLNLVPIETMVLVETCILSSDYSVLEIGRDLAEWNEFVAFAIRPVVNPTLQAALDVHCSCRWVDPPAGHKEYRGKHPNEYDADGQTSHKEPKKTLSTRDLLAQGWCRSHISEYRLNWIRAYGCCAPRDLVRAVLRKPASLLAHWITELQTEPPIAP